MGEFLIISIHNFLFTCVPFWKVFNLFFVLYNSGFNFVSIQLILGLISFLWRKILSICRFCNFVVSIQGHIFERRGNFFNGKYRKWDKLHFDIFLGSWHFYQSFSEYLSETDTRNWKIIHFATVSCKVVMKDLVLWPLFYCVSSCKKREIRHKDNWKLLTFRTTFCLIFEYFWTIFFTIWLFFSFTPFSLSNCKFLSTGCPLSIEK